MATLEERIEQVKQATGYVEESQAVEEFEGWHYGDRVRVIDDDENEGLYSGDEGFAVPCKVGAPEYGNERVALYFLPDEHDTPSEVESVNIEAA